jgi:diguanylate cyclase (GGDEF)-like protein
MFTTVYNFFTGSISRLVMASFVFVLLLPLGFLASSLPEQSWGSVKQEILDKHQLIAKSTGETIRLYFSSYQKSLQVFANTADLIHSKSSDTVKERMGDLLKSLENVDVISFLSLDDYSRVVSIRPNAQGTFKSAVKEPFLKYLTFGNRHSSIRDVSPVFKSTISNKPVVLVKTYVYDENNTKRGLLLAEVGLGYINNVCSEIGYGSKEYCTIVDSLGKVVAHPNTDWVEQSYDLSKLAIVQEIKKGRSGSVDFYSPYLEEDAVAGFSTVNKLGWGVMISQSKSNLDSPLKQVMFTILMWLIIGIIFALIVAYMLTRQITKPINSLVLKSKEAGVRTGSFNLGDVPKGSPHEIIQLWIALSSLIAKLQRSNKEVKKLNYSLSKEVQKATAKLRKTNKYLYRISSRDHLTKIANRRFFEDTVNRTLQAKLGEKVSIILIDVDKFKFINDTYGHDAGDLALVHIAELMQKCTREGDLPARLGGDEFVIYIKDCGPKSLHRVAENLRKAVEDNPIVWAGQEIKLTLSVGTVNHKIDGKITLTELLKFADEAMYISKENGRNHVSTYSFEAAARVTKAKEVLAAKAVQLARATKNSNKLVNTNAFESLGQPNSDDEEYFV